MSANRIALLLGCVAATASAAATATEQATDQLYVFGLGTYFHTDTARRTLAGEPDDGKGIQLGFGWSSADRWGLETNLFAELLETETNAGTDFYRGGLGLDLVYSLAQRTQWTPYALVGAGAVYNDVLPDSADNWDAYANAGLGLLSSPMGRPQLKLRAEARYIYDQFIDGGRDDYRFGLGVEFPVGVSAEVEKVEVIKERVKLVEVAVGLQDADNDGIDDSRDQCPQTAEGERVDGSGCPLGDLIELRGVTFDTASDRLQPNALTVLTGAAEILRRYPEMQVQVAGHTDDVGDAAYNQQLSQKRADAVRDYLILRGVQAAALTARGFGESQPLASNRTEAGREQNRRVELRINN